MPRSSPGWMRGPATWMRAWPAGDAIPHRRTARPRRGGLVRGLAAAAHLAPRGRGRADALLVVHRLSDRWCRGTAPGRTGRGRRGGSSHRTGRRHARGGGRRGAAGRHGTVGMCRNRRRPGGAGGCRAGGDAGGRVDRRDGRLRGDRPPTAGRWCGARPCSARVSWRERSPDGDGEGWSCRPAHAMADAGPSTAPRPAPMGRSTRVPDVWCTGRTARRDSGARRRTLPMDLPPRGTTCHRLSAHVERPPDWSAVDGARWNVLDGVTVRHGRRSRWSAAVAGRSGWRWPAGPGSGCAKTSPCVGRMTLVRLIRARRFSGAEDTVGVRSGPRSRRGLAYGTVLADMAHPQADRGAARPHR